MVGVPRSQVLVKHEITVAGGTPAFACPPDCVTLVKSAHFFNGSGTASEVLLLVGDAAGTFQTRMFDVQLDTLKNIEWNGWIVLNPGDIVLGYATAVPVIVWISGAVLLGPPPFPPGELLVELLEPAIRSS